MTGSFLTGLAQVLAAVTTAPPTSVPVEALWLAAGGALGAFARAYFIRHQPTLSRETGFDCSLGLALGLLWNVPVTLPVVGAVWPLFELSPAASYVQRAAIVAIVALVAIDILKRVLFRYAPDWVERRLGAVLPTRNGQTKSPDSPK